MQKYREVISSGALIMKLYNLHTNLQAQVEYLPILFSNYAQTWHLRLSMPVPPWQPLEAFPPGTIPASLTTLVWIAFWELIPAYSYSQQYSTVPSTGTLPNQPTKNHLAKIRDLFLFYWEELTLQGLWDTTMLGPTIFNQCAKAAGVQEMCSESWGSFIEDSSIF